MRRQQQPPGRRLPRAHQRQQRDDHRQQPHRRERHRDRDLDHRRAGRQQADQDDLRRRRPDDQGRQGQPDEGEAEIVRQRPDADIGADQDVDEDRRPCLPDPGQDGRRRPGLGRWKHRHAPLLPCRLSRRNCMPPHGGGAKRARQPAPQIPRAPGNSGRPQISAANR